MGSGKYILLVANWIIRGLVKLLFRRIFCACFLLKFEILFLQEPVWSYNYVNIYCILIFKTPTKVSKFLDIRYYHVQFKRDKEIEFSGLCLQEDVMSQLCLLPTDWSFVNDVRCCFWLLCFICDAHRGCNHWWSVL